MKVRLGCDRSLFCTTTPPTLPADESMMVLWSYRNEDLQRIGLEAVFESCAR